MLDSRKIHLLCIEFKIKYMCCVIDNETWHYTYITDFEYQFGRLGDMPTNYVLREDDMHIVDIIINKEQIKNT